jgi:hypothetical protein
MHTENSIFNKCCNRKIIEQVNERLPQLHGVPTSAFIPEPIDSRDVLAFMISSQQEDSLGILDLVGKQKT